MRIAVALDSKGGICGHFGQSVAFEILDLEEGAVVARQRRDNPHQGRAGRGGLAPW